MNEASVPKSGKNSTGTAKPQKTGASLKSEKTGASPMPERNSASPKHEKDSASKPQKDSAASKPDASASKSENLGPAASKLQKKTAKGPNLIVLLVPVAVIGALVLAFFLPPSHALIVNGPLKSLFAKKIAGAPPAAQPAVKNQAPEAPGSAAAQPAVQPAVTDQAPQGSSAEVKRLTAALATARRAAAFKDARITKLQAEITKRQPWAGGGAGSGATAGAGASAAAGVGTGGTASPVPGPKTSPTAVPDDVKRTAAYWAGMDADKAADIVKVLPPADVRAIFSQMQADAVAEIMNALPAKTAAKLTAPTPLAP